ncbi:hypothetical protein [Brachybacterium sp. sponge]|uniref:hypothetical protein n=1 Tax=Brachybacterium sp. sponge TaxID=1775432 RepID=UPI0007A3E8A1|nr:hypothetical protein [Brachybacterium sp. sponge]
MSTAPSPETRAIAKVLQSLLEPRQPARADLCFVHVALTEDPDAGLPAFHYWAAGIDPGEDDAPERLARALLTTPPTARAEHVSRACRALADHAAAAEVSAPRGARDAARVTYLLWAAAMTLHSPSLVLSLCAEAGDVDLPRTVAHPLFSLAMRRLNAAANTQEVQA